MEKCKDLIAQKLILALLKKYIDTKFNIDCDIAVEFRVVNIYYKLDALRINIKLSKSSDDIAMIIDQQFGVTNRTSFNDPNPKVTDFKEEFVENREYP